MQMLISYSDKKNSFQPLIVQKAIFGEFLP